MGPYMQKLRLRGQLSGGLMSIKTLEWAADMTNIKWVGSE